MSFSIIRNCLAKAIKHSCKLMETGRRIPCRHLTDSGGSDEQQDGYEENATKTVYSSVSATLNEVLLIGGVGQNPTLSEAGFYRFSVATNAFGENKGERVVVADWHNISIYKDHPIARYVANIRKGDRVFVKGRLSYRTVPDERTGMPHKYVNIKAFQIINLTQKYRTEIPEQMESYLQDKDSEVS